MAWWALRLASNPLRVPIPIDGTVLGLTLLTTAVTTLAFGLAPAMRATARQPSASLGPVSAGSDAVPTQSRMRRVLIVAQVSLSLALLATASQLVDTLQSQSFSGGAPPDRILVAQFDLRPLKRPAADVDDFYRRLLDDVRHLPGVEAAGLSRHSSVWTFGRAANGGSIRVWEPGDRADDGNDTIGRMIAGDLFQALGLRLAAGRVFKESEAQEPPRVAIVNQTLAARMKAPALGSVLRVAASDGDFSAAREVQIVGIVEPAVDAAYAEDVQTAPRVYLPSALEPEPTLALYIRARAKRYRWRSLCAIWLAASRRPCQSAASSRSRNSSNAPSGPSCGLASRRGPWSRRSSSRHRRRVRRVIIHRGDALPRACNPYRDWRRPEGDIEPDAS